MSVTGVKGEPAAPGAVGYETGKTPAKPLPFSRDGWLPAAAPASGTPALPPGNGEPSFMAGDGPPPEAGVPGPPAAFETKPVKIEASASAAKGPAGLGAAYPGATGPVKMLLSIKPGCSIPKDDCFHPKPKDLHPEVLYVKGEDNKIYQYTAKVGDLRVSDKSELECLRRDAKGGLSWVPVKTGSKPTIGPPTPPKPAKVEPSEFLAARDEVKPAGRLLAVDARGKLLDAGSVHLDKAKLTWVDMGGEEVSWIDNP